MIQSSQIELRVLKYQQRSVQSLKILKWNEKQSYEMIGQIEHNYTTVAHVRRAGLPEKKD